MTLVAVWKAGQRINAIADTRIARAAGNVLTEHGPKLLPLPISCKQPGATGHFDQEVVRTTFGFGYCGSTLSALSTHALASTLCSNLIAAPGALPPTLSEIASAVAAISLQYIRDVGQLAPENAAFGAIIFGHCVRENRLRAVELRPVRESNQVGIQTIEHDLNAEGNVVIIGTSVERLRERIRRLRDQAEHQVIIDDAPTRALQGVIADGSDNLVGGSIQQAWAAPMGFTSVANMVPLMPQPAEGPNVAFTVLGFDVYTAFNVGAYHVGMFGRM